MHAPLSSRELLPEWSFVHALHAALPLPCAFRFVEVPVGGGYHLGARGLVAQMCIWECCEVSAEATPGCLLGLGRDTCDPLSQPARFPLQHALLAMLALEQVAGRRAHAFEHARFGLFDFPRAFLNGVLAV